MSKMKNLFFSLFTMLLMVGSGTLSAQNVTDSYEIRRGDVIDVMVMEHPEFSLSGTIILPDGFIQYPALGSIKAAGMTSQMLTDTLQKALERYVVNPMVTIFIRKLENQMVNVFGYVNNPGQYQIYEGIDLISAISKAGGIKKMRRTKIVYIIHTNMTTEKVDIRDYIGADSATMAQVPMVYAGETVYVKEPREWNWAVISAIASSLSLVVSIISLIQ